MDPVCVISRAFKQVEDSGSATAIICMLKKDELICTNIGDSGFKLIRFDENNQPFILMESEEQQHDFNTPYQLCKLPTVKCVQEKLIQSGLSEIQAQGVISKFKTLAFCQDEPETAKLYQTRIQEGDLLILGSDGLFDNLFTSEILDTIRTTIKDRGKEVSAREIASAIADRAYRRSISSSESSPFSIKYGNFIKAKLSVFLIKSN